LSPEFDDGFIRSLEETHNFDASYIDQKIAYLRASPVEIKCVLDKDALMQEGVEKHILIYQLDGKEVRFNLSRNRASNKINIDEPVFTNSNKFDNNHRIDYEFLSVYAQEHIKNHVELGVVPNQNSPRAAAVRSEDEAEISL
jgi:hypothetical protein